mmetsp:Transcript_14639/g.25929  ORF Transcript_14639/g.25929 Transcript_14639/m.25929 type:complete len:502 (-) Transcript_14639:162-1667(-)
MAPQAEAYQIKVPSSHRGNIAVDMEDRNSGPRDGSREQGKHAKNAPWPALLLASPCEMPRSAPMKTFDFQVAATSVRSADGDDRAGLNTCGGAHDGNDCALVSVPAPGNIQQAAREQEVDGASHQPGRISKSECTEEAQNTCSSSRPPWEGFLNLIHRAPSTRMRQLSIRPSISLSVADTVKSEVPEGVEIGELSSENVRHSVGEIKHAYQFHKLLGSGSFGEVWLSTHIWSQEKYAIKKIWLESPKVANYAEKELRIFAKLSNPYIVKLHKVYCQNDYLHLVMDLCTGGDLKHYLEKYWEHPGRIAMKRSLCENGHPLGLPDDEIGPRLWQMLTGVAYMHHHRFTHRDLKPENMMIKDMNEFSQLQLTDFGYATRFKKGEKMQKQVGSLAYMAPEVLRGSYTEKCDIWSIGVVCYKLCLCDFPWPGSTQDEVAKNIVHDVMMNHSRLWHRVHKDLQALVVNILMTRDPAKRLSAKQILTSNTWLRKHGLNKEGDACCVLS